MSATLDLFAPPVPVAVAKPERPRWQGARPREGRELECDEPGCGFVAESDAKHYRHMVGVHHRIAIGRGFWRRIDDGELVALLRGGT